MPVGNGIIVAVPRTAPRRLAAPASGGLADGLCAQLIRKAILKFAQNFRCIGQPSGATFA
jgi:hypothetical protein